MTPEDIRKIQNLCQWIIDKPRPIDDQPHVRQGIYVWCEDWEMVEVCKYIFNGREAYIGDPPPNRLKNNPLWSKENIMQKAQSLLDHCSAQDIVDLFTTVRTA